jgi:hypothetical protein
MADLSGVIGLGEWVGGFPNSEEEDTGSSITPRFNGKLYSVYAIARTAKGPQSAHLSNVKGVHFDAPYRLHI